MSLVQTVQGPVEAADLGRTLVHEHVFVLTPDVQQNHPEHWGDEQARIQDAVTRLKALAAAGVRTILDPTVIGLGRDVPRVAKIAAQVPELQIVVATGVYTYDSVPMYFHYRGPALTPVLGIDVPDPMVDMFVKDIEQGISGTDVRAGFLKCAIDAPGMTPGVERIMRAVGKAQRQTGVPVTVHTHPATRTGLDVKRVLCDEEGVDPRRVVLGHSGDIGPDAADVDHLVELADAGFVLGMDRFGIYLENTMESRADTVVELCRRGYAASMSLSQDASCYIDWIDPDVMAFLPDWHYLHLEQKVLPYLREQGVTEAQLDTMLVDVPRRLFEPDPTGA